MKKIIVMIGWALLSASAQAQVAKFMGVPIQGTVEEFASALMESSSLERYYTDRNGVILSGDYAGEKCLFILKAAENMEVREVDVKFPSSKTWKQLEARYNSLKEKLTKKYGEPLYCEERFVDDSFPRLRYDHVLKNQCFYSSEYKLPGMEGFVRLFIKNFSDQTAAVVLRYNSGTWSREKFQGIMNDLSRETQKPDQNHLIGGYGTFDLRGRTIQGVLPVPAYDVQDEGNVVVNIVVDPLGRVVGAEVSKSSDTRHPALLKAALEAARQARFNTIDGTDNQLGTITYFFNQG